MWVGGAIVVDQDTRKQLTFEQAEGAEPLPRQLKLKEMSPELRAQLWANMYQFLQEDDWSRELKDPWQAIMRRVWIDRLHRPADEYNARYQYQVDTLKSVFFQGNYVEIFGLLQFIIRLQICPDLFRKSLSYYLQKCHAAYRLIDGDTIVPFASEQEAAAVQAAFADAAKANFSGARSHLVAAAEFLTAGQFADSIRESVHAVEATARKISPGTTFGKALDALDKAHAIHPSLKRGFGAIYGYSSDEAGIRHPLIDEPVAAVDEADAMFMMGACASFISYMIAKVPSAG